MLTVYIALIHILINGPNRIEFPVPPFNSTFLRCSDPNARGLNDADPPKTCGVDYMAFFVAKFRFKNCFLEH